MSQDLHRDMFVAYLFFCFNLKEKGGRRPPSKIILCLCLGFHYHYYLKAIRQLIARLAHRMSFLLHLPSAGIVQIHGPSNYIVKLDQIQ